MARTLLLMSLMERPEDFAGIAPTRVQTKTVAVAPDELETLYEQAERVVPMAEIEAYLRSTGAARDDATCLGDMLSEAAVPAVKPVEEPRTVRAYCEPLLPFLPVEDLAEPRSDELEELEDFEDLVAPIDEPVQSQEDLSDPVVEYLRAMSDDFSDGVERTMMGVEDARSDPLARISLPAQDTPFSKLPLVVPVPSPMTPRSTPDPTIPEQAVVKTTCVRGRGRKTGAVSSALVPALKKRRTPLWLAALMGATIAGLLLTSSLFTVEVLASKQSAKNLQAPAKTAPTNTPAPTVTPR